jgi:predicted dehydrogenase
MPRTSKSSTRPSRSGSSHGTRRSAGASRLGRPTRRPLHRPVRYAVVGLGHIAQAAILPAFAHARRNSVLAALVSDDRVKLTALSRKYRVTRTFGYDQFEECLAEVDADFIALPNSMHAEYTIRAARQGVHVLCEKPMAVTVEECERMIAACDAAPVKLMIAYRLHFEPLNMQAMTMARQGKLGDLKYFSSTFSMRVREGNIRTDPALGGGTLYDIGVYCVNAARYLFGSDPVEVFAASVNSGAAATREIDESTAAILRFDGGRVATFITSFNAADVASYRLVGTKGHIVLDPSFEYAEALASTTTIGDRPPVKVRGRKHDQFAAELLYFSDCIAGDRRPEPSGLEGLQDVAIVRALYESARSGRSMPIPPRPAEPLPQPDQRIVRPPVGKVKLVKAKSAHQE